MNLLLQSIFTLAMIDIEHERHEAKLPAQAGLKALSKAVQLEDCCEPHHCITHCLQAALASAAACAVLAPNFTSTSDTAGTSMPVVQQAIASSSAHQQQMAIINTIPQLIMPAFSDQYTEGLHSFQAAVFSTNHLLLLLLPSQ